MNKPFDIGDYAVNVTDKFVTVGFLAKIEATMLVSDCIFFRGEDETLRCRPASHYVYVTLDELYADEEWREAHERNYDFDIFPIRRIAVGVAESETWTGEEYFETERESGCAYDFDGYEALAASLAPEEVTAGSILRKAAEITDGSRNVTHGVRERSFVAIADLWNTYLKHKTYTDFPAELSPIDVAMMMALLKVGRFLTGTPIEDHFIDLAGYAGVAGELAAKGAM